MTMSAAGARPEVVPEPAPAGTPDRREDGAPPDLEAATLGVPTDPRASPELEPRCVRRRGTESACSRSEVGTRMAVALPLLPGAKGVKVRAAGERGGRALL